VSERPDVIIADLCMHAGGLGLVARLRSVAPRTPIVLLSASLPAGTCTPGVAVCLCKPVRMADLAAAIGQVVPA
jgi:CheY-like chemotaxis protein